MSLNPRNKDDLVFLYSKLLDQIVKMYENPELKRIQQAVKQGRWDDAFYPRYQPKLPEYKDET